MFNFSFRIKKALVVCLFVVFLFYGFFSIRIPTKNFGKGASPFSHKKNHLHRHNSADSLMPRELRVTYKGSYHTWESSSLEPEKGKLMVTISSDDKDQILADYLDAQGRKLDNKEEAKSKTLESQFSSGLKETFQDQIQTLKQIRESSYYLNVKLFEDSIFDFIYLQIPVIYDSETGVFDVIPSLDNIVVSSFKHLKLQQKINCESVFLLAYMHLNEQDFTSNNETIDTLKYRFSINIAASECSNAPEEDTKGVNFDVPEDYYFQFLGDAKPQYGLLSNGEKGFFALAFFFQLASMLAQHILCNLTKENPSFGKKLSLHTVMLISLSDLVMIFFWMFRYMLVLSIYYAILTLLSFLKYLIHDQRLLIVAWKAHNSGEFGQTRQEAMNNARLFMIRYYALTILMVAIAWVLRYHFPVILIFQCSIWLPQLAKNIRENNRNLISLFLLVAEVLPVTFLTIYLLLWKANVFNHHTHRGLGSLILSYVFIQIAVLAFQGVWGSRFFIPQPLRPVGYNYYVNVLQDENASTQGEEIPECPICMNKLTEDITGDHQEASSHIKVMRAPCKHLFHTKCLKNWMGVKMECPICREKLPELEEQSLRVSAL